MMTISAEWWAIVGPEVNARLEAACMATPSRFGLLLAGYKAGFEAGKEVGSMAKAKKACKGKAKKCCK